MKLEVGQIVTHVEYGVSRHYRIVEVRAEEDKLEYRLVKLNHKEQDEGLPFWVMEYDLLAIYVRE